MYAGPRTFANGKWFVYYASVRVPDSHYRENRPQEVDAYISEGKIPVDVDLSQHPEKSAEAHGCMLLILFTAPARRVHFVHRADGKGCRVHKRCQDRSGDVSLFIFHCCRRFESGITEWKNS